MKQLWLVAVLVLYTLPVLAERTRPSPLSEDESHLVTPLVQFLASAALEKQVHFPGVYNEPTVIIYRQTGGHSREDLVGYNGRNNQIRLHPGSAKSIPLLNYVPPTIAAPTPFGKMKGMAALVQAIRAVDPNLEVRLDDVVDYTDEDGPIKPREETMVGRTTGNLIEVTYEQDHGHTKRVAKFDAQTLAFSGGTMTLAVRDTFVNLLYTFRLTGDEGREELESLRMDNRQTASSSGYKGRHL